MLIIEADGLYEQKTTSGSAPVSQEQESKSMVVTDNGQIRNTLSGMFPVFSSVSVSLCQL